MKVLVVCYCYPPDPGPRAYRWSAIAEHWAAAGHEVHVVSAGKGGAPARETLNGVDVHRVGGAISENLRIFIERRRSRGRPNDAGDQHLGASGFSGWAGVLKRLHDLTWQKVYWPESSCLWYFPAARQALRLARAHAFDAMISVSTPHTGHLVGARLKRAFPSLRWIADIGDPLSFGEPPFNNRALYDNKNRRAERALLASADAAAVTVAACAEEYVRRFPEARGKITVVPPLFSAPTPAAAQAGPDGARRRLVFTGSLYAAIRNPEFLLSVLAPLFERLPDLDVHFFGRSNDCADVFDRYRKRLGDRLRIHGPVSRDAALAAITEAAALINISNKTRLQLPSKLVDYAATGKPIINVSCLADDASADFLRDYGASVTLVDDNREARDAMVERLHDFLNTAEPLPPEDVSAFLSPYRIGPIARAYEDLLSPAATATEPDDRR